MIVDYRAAWYVDLRNWMIFGFLFQDIIAWLLFLANIFGFSLPFVTFTNNFSSLFLRSILNVSKFESETSSMTLKIIKKNVPEKFGFLTPNYSNICLVFSILSRDLSKILDLPIKSGCLLWMTPNLNIFHIEIWFFKPTLALLFKIKLNKWDILHKCHNFQNFFIIFCQRKIPQTWQN